MFAGTEIQLIKIRGTMATALYGGYYFSGKHSPKKRSSHLSLQPLIVTATSSGCRPLPHGCFRDFNFFSFGQQFLADQIRRPGIRTCQKLLHGPQDITSRATFGPRTVLNRLAGRMFDIPELEFENLKFFGLR